MNTRAMLAAVLLVSPLAWTSDAPPAHEAAEDAGRTVPGAASKGVAACHDDIERFCAKVKPGEGRLGRCLEKNRAKLSKPCRAFVLHGGKAHEWKAFREIDTAVLAVSTPAATAPAAPVDASTAPARAP